MPLGPSLVLSAVLFSIGKALRNAGNRVVYFAGYK